MTEEWKKHIDAIRATIEDLQEWQRRYTRPAKLLVVDDDPRDVALLLLELSKYYCEAEVCDDAEAAQTMLEAKHYDFVLVDQKMPKLTGMELLKRTIPGSGSGQFFIVSGVADSNLLTEATRMGAVFLPKPVKPFFLIPKVPKS